MLLSRTEIGQYRRILLGTLREFKRICEENSLQWWMAFGSAIGAARHKGFIPWDDDVDVFMPRADYERLYTLSVPGYKIIRAGKGEDYPFPYMKFCDGNTTIWERQMYPCVFGVFIDVFPLDEAGEGDAEAVRVRYRKVFGRYKRAQRVYPRGAFMGKIMKLDFRGAFKVVADELWHAQRIDSYREKFLHIDKEVSGRRGENYIVYGTSSDYRGLTLPRNFFEETLPMEFEGMEVNMPVGYDAMLRMYYGDYMVLPPEDKRVSGHYHYFVDLRRGLTLDEAIECMAMREKDNKA